LRAIPAGNAPDILPATHRLVRYDAAQSGGAGKKRAGRPGGTAPTSEPPRKDERDRGRVRPPHNGREYGKHADACHIGQMIQRNVRRF
jgi:hypothetical protein